MADEFDEVIWRIMHEYRHLLTEVERRADREFVFQAELQGPSDPAAVEELTTAMQRSLEDPDTAELFNKGRERFLQDVARRVVAEHGETLPRCGACGAVLKTPNPKQCFDCDYDWGAAKGEPPDNPQSPEHPNS